MARNLGNWIVSLSTAMDHISEAPKNFHIWAAISVVGSVLKNRVSWRRGPYTLYPNMYVVMVSPPGVGKGESIHPAYNIAKDLNLINVMSDRITAPKIIERLASGFPSQLMQSNGSLHLGKDSSAVLFSTELQTLLTSSDWMLTFLCDAWDKGEYQYDTKNSGSATVKGMCTSLVGACTPDYIRKLNKDAMAAINTGFTARTIFVYAEDKSKIIPWPKSLEDTAIGRKLLADLSNDLAHIATLTGTPNFTHQARWAFEQEYRRVISKVESDSDVMVNFKARWASHVLKTAVIMSCAESDSMVVTDIHMKIAVRAVDTVMENLDRAFRGVGNSVYAESQARVEKVIESRQFIDRDTILSFVYRHMSGMDLDMILNILVSAGKVTTFDQGGKRFFKPKIRAINVPFDLNKFIKNGKP